MTTEQDEEFIPSVADPSGEDAFGDSPLLDFWGTGAGWGVRSGVGRQSGKPWRRIQFYFTEVEVLESTDVYAFPTADLSIFYNDPAKTPKRKEGQGTNDWDAWAQSVKVLIPESPNVLNELMGGQRRDEGDEIVGLRQHWKRVPTSIRVPPKPEDEDESKHGWHDELVPTWQVIEVEGYAAPAKGQSVHVVLAELADGKTDKEFYAAALADQRIISNTSVVGAITNRTIISELEEMHLITVSAEGKISKSI